MATARDCCNTKLISARLELLGTSVLPSARRILRFLFVTTITCVSTTLLELNTRRIGLLVSWETHPGKQRAHAGGNAWRHSSDSSLHPVRQLIH